LEYFYNINNKDEYKRKKKKSIELMSFSNDHYNILNYSSYEKFRNNKKNFQESLLNKVYNMNGLFTKCSSLKSLPHISKWNMENVKAIRYMFSECTQLKLLPDISKWKIYNIIDMHFLFNECSSLKSLFQNGIWRKFKI
jgi:surface protein